MRVVHVIAGDLNGGAAKGAYLLHQSLLQSGVISHVLSNGNVNRTDMEITSIKNNFVKRLFNLIRFKLDQIANVIYSVDESNYFSNGLIGYDITKERVVKEADIIHLHWINAGFVNVRHLKKLGKPIVWTLRDMWPFTGGCHYSMGCEKFISTCGKCPVLHSNSKYDLSSIVFKYKKKYLLSDIKCVAISNWLKEQAQQSVLMQNHDIRMINNAIDVNVFTPIGKTVARDKLGIQTKKKILLVGAANISHKYKGFDKFLQSLLYLDPENYLLCFFGKLNECIMDNMKFEFKNFGYVNELKKLQTIYSASDVFIAPSIFEAFGKTIAESMACGVPVVCFDATGPKDIVRHKVDGYKVLPYDLKDMAHGIEWVAYNEEYQTLALNARNKIVKEFSLEIAAKKYIQLYEELINE